MKELLIRKATEKDTEILEMLFQITRQNTFKSASPQNFKIGDYKKLVAGEEVWVAELDGNIPGFISLLIQDNFIHNLFVYPDYQDCGIGAQLLQKAEECLSRPMELKVTTILKLLSFMKSMVGKKYLFMKMNRNHIFCCVSIENA